MNSKSLKRTLSAGLCAVAVASAAAAAPEEMPDWAVEVIQVKNGSKPLDAGAKDTGPQGRWFEQEEKGHAAPIFHDWDGDGLKDLIVGGFAGRFRVFKNIGTADTPAFDGYEWLEAGSEVAHIRNFCCVAAGPRMVDINDDGIDDLVAGTYSPGLIYWFEGSKDGLKPRQVLTDWDGIPVVTRLADLPNASYLAYGAKPAWMDWDADGDPDLIIGNSHGDLVLRRNHGPASFEGITPVSGQPVFDSFAWSEAYSQIDLFTKIEDEGGALKNEEYLSPTVADWDGDGLEDLIIGVQSGAVYFVKNIGEEGEPTFAAPVQLLGPRAGGEFPPHQLVNEGDMVQRGSRISVEVTDYNGDGKPDLMLGDYALSLVLKPGLTSADMKAIEDIKVRLVALDKRAGLNPPYDPLRDRVKSAFVYYENKELAAELRALEGELLPYLVPIKDEHQDRLIAYERLHGHVWVYIRR
ncbi:FG-GAP repeat domain-containing protein [Kordiimonas gwangyangensis]|uniref:FG-GAP repeat domain-containing protein n=1 Tax=Kordiimonas gwangyangensis TaxID=288022 RepID=UPI000369AD0F|nr:VCBS repeat-containing protein [Kordiimonas gwangyangensis]